ncbi:MAG: 4Fe-4S dicluster domain-containing protein [Beijerinckiaceae bacterium]
MAGESRTIFVCDCEGSMLVDGAAVGRACGAKVVAGTQLCGVELDRVRPALASPGDVVIACTAQAPLFREASEDAGEAANVAYVNIRETAGWSAEGAKAGPKMAALIAAAAEPMPAMRLVSITSQGVALIYGVDEQAIEAARRLSDRLDVTVILARPQDVPPPRDFEFPIFKGVIRTATGSLGRFELTVDDFALPAPSSRAALRFGAPRSGAVSRCDIVLDLTGGAPLFPAHDLRAGYLRPDARDPAAVERAIAEAGNLVGTFDKPRYVDFHAELCAHSRSKVTGCTRCLDLCPTGAITPAGDHVAIDAEICAGCGACAAACPTGAASYALPPADSLSRKLRLLLQAYRAAGGENAVVMFHDGDHGDPLIAALARFGEGLPANVLPVRVNEVTQLGPEAIASVFAYGGVAARILARNKPRHDVEGARSIVAACETIVSGLGFGVGVVSLIQADDPDDLRAQLLTAPVGVASSKPAGMVARGAKRGVLETIFRELHEAAPAPVPVIALERGAPFGGVNVKVDGCTLCHSCVAACPTGALADNPEKPMLRFSESMCVQCGLCQSTCPEKVITLEPRLDFAAWREGHRIMKEEEPFPCIVCGKPFGTKSAIERVAAKLEGRHWMFSGVNAKRLDVIRMCEDCRVETVVNEGFDPHGAPQRPPVMTTEDYLKARERDGKDSLN